MGKEQSIRKTKGLRTKGKEHESCMHQGGGWKGGRWGLRREKMGNGRGKRERRDIEGRGDNLKWEDRKKRRI